MVLADYLETKLKAGDQTVWSLLAGLDPVIVPLLHRAPYRRELVGNAQDMKFRKATLLRRVKSWVSG